MYRIQAPRSVHSEILLPASKSISNRVLVMQALLGGDLDRIENLSDADDTQVLLRALRSPCNEVVDVGAAGTAMRFLTAYLCMQQGTRVLTGSARMKQRPIGILVEALRALGAQIEYLEAEGYPPLKITGTTLQCKDITLPASTSSQFISALLLIAPLLVRCKEQEMVIRLDGTLVSRPYIEMTIAIAKEFGADMTFEHDRITVRHSELLRPIHYRVESDWSAASYAYSIVSLAPQASELFLPHLSENSLQGDRELLNLFKPLGVQTRFADCGAYISSNGTRAKSATQQISNSPVLIDLSSQPDLAQTLIVAYALCGIAFEMKGLRTLKIKETDRIHAMRQEMGKLDYQLNEFHTKDNDIGIAWSPQTEETDNPSAAPYPPLQARSPISTYDDHRMAMAFAPAAMRFEYIDIEEPQVVSKSFPAFWQRLEQLGFQIEEI